MRPKITCTCFYREDDCCFLGRPGPEATCPDYKRPTVVNRAPLDPEIKKAYEKIDA